MTARYLAGHIDLPYITMTGRVVTRPGYDSETCLYLDLPLDYQPRIAERPSEQAVRDALLVMMAPWLGYQFASDDSAAGMVSAPLAAVTRPLLGICPAILIDASQQGSGKTKAATALGALIEGKRPAVTPFSGSLDDELRKRMVAGAVEGVRFHCIDNITGYFKSAVLAAVLTNGRVSDRLLGQSRMVDVQVRSLLTLTGNNSSFDADLQRRTVHIRINGGSNPTHRAFNFCPVTVALTQRRAIAEAACTIIRAYFAAGAPVVAVGDAGGFADWNLMCRQVVLWLVREGLTDVLPWSLGDPAGSLLADPSDGDPEIEALGSLLAALWALSDGRDFTSSEALAWHRAGEHDRDGPFGGLRDAVVAGLGRQEVTVVGLGSFLGYRRDRDVGGLKLLKGGSDRLKVWRIVRTDPERPTVAG